MNTRFLRIVCFFAVALVLLSSDLFAGENLEQQINALVKPLIKEHRIHGVSIGIIKNGKKHAFNFGRTNSDDVAPDQYTVYEIGSISKTFTSILLADFVNRGQMKLSDPAEKYTKGIFNWPDYKGEKITLMQLAQHRSALPRMPDNFNPENINNPYIDYDKTKLYEFFSKYKLERKPGSEYAYSNLAVGTLGHILELQSGKDYELLLKDIIFNPLQMKYTSLKLSDEQKKRLAKGHDGQGNEYSNWDMGVLAGAGGIRSNVNDMLLFLSANLAPSDDRLGRAISLASNPPDNKADNIMLGWHRDKNSQRLWHNGQTGGYHSYSMFDREKGLALVILSNTATNLVDKLGASVKHLLKTGETRPVLFRKSVALTEQELKEYEGKYYLSKDFILEVKLINKQLEVKATGQSSFPVYAEKKDYFFYKIVDAQISFMRHDGKVDGLTLHQNGANMKATKDRLPPPPEYNEIELPEDILDHYIGCYQLAPSFTITITREGKLLLAQATGQKKVPIYPMSDTKFFYKIVDAQISFNKNKTGKITGLILHQNGMNQPAMKLEE